MSKNKREKKHKNIWKLNRLKLFLLQKMSAQNRSGDSYRFLSIKSSKDVKNVRKQ